MKGYTETERQEHVKNWRSSRLSKVAYAKSAGICPTTFYTWAQCKARKEKQDFVEINKGLIQKPKEDIVIERGTITIRLPLSAEVKELQTVFNALEGLK